MSGSDVLFELATAASEDREMLFGKIDHLGQIYLDQAAAPLAGTPVSLCPLERGRRFMALMFGHTLVIVGLVGGPSEFGNLATSTLIPWAGDPDLPLPHGTLECDGKAYHRSQHPGLFARIGFNYGALGSDYFRVPDLRGKTLFGWDKDDPKFINPGTYGGELEHELTVEEMPSHAHSYTRSEYFIRDGWGDGRAWVPVADENGFANYPTSNPTGGGRPFNLLPSYATVRYLIKT